MSHPKKKMKSRGNYGGGLGELISYQVLLEVGKGQDRLRSGKRQGKGCDQNGCLK